jgi:threonine/homoserine/homoserine lactone efflux protein
MPDKARSMVARLPGLLGATRAPCPHGCDRALDFAILTAPEKRDPAMLAKLDAVAGRALVAASATLFVALKWVGAAYLIWLGVRLIRSAPRHGLAVPRMEVSARGVFGHMATVTALNPKSIAFFVAFVPQFIRPDAPLLPQFAVLVATFVGLATLNALAYALAADRLRGWIARPAIIAWLTRAGGATLIAMGVLTASLRRAA